ncbi:MAG: hypothetical protein HC796_11395 [Synechococcaceae cyanobacterium RL_1_2]|nr:hypothetical protein [Synechococcaceae cyanobacterium RL_1_2]
MIRDSSQKAQMVHNEEVKAMETEQIIADEVWSFIKKQKHCLAEELSSGD